MKYTIEVLTEVSPMIYNQLTNSFYSHETCMIEIYENDKTKICIHHEIRIKDLEIEFLLSLVFDFIKSNNLRLENSDEIFICGTKIDYKNYYEEYKKE